VVLGRHHSLFCLRFLLPFALASRLSGLSGLNGLNGLSRLSGLGSVVVLVVRW
jgi:hypothetical protein